MAIEVRPFEDGAGVEITGLDLSQPLTEEAFAIWRDAFLDQGIVVIRDQHFNAAQHVAFSKWFGPLEDFPDPKDQAVGFETILRVTNIERDGGELRSFDTDIGFKSFVLGTGDWHIDSSFRTNPGKASLLYALEVPPKGGDTVLQTPISPMKPSRLSEKKSWRRFPWCMILTPFGGEVICPCGPRR